MLASRAMDEERRIEHGRSFATVSDAYDRGRPTYPAEAVAWMVGPEPRVVLDVGAGTGALTRPLVAAGHTVIAVDPLLDMLGHLRRRSLGPEVAAVAGSAERLPVCDASVDTVTVAAAYHWFDEETAVPELARVLRPGGVLAMAWNVRDESVPWVRRMSRLIGHDADLPDPTGRLGLSGLFGPVEWAQFRLFQHVDKPRLLDLVRSRSYVAVLAPDERDQVLDRVAELYDKQRGDMIGLQLPYTTHCLRAVRLQA